MTQQSAEYAVINFRDFEEKSSYDEQAISYVCMVGEVLAPRIGEMVDGLCSWLSTRSEHESSLRDRNALARIRQFQEEYWQEFLCGGVDAGSACRRQAVGRDHVRFGLGLVVYVAAVDWCGEWISHEIDALNWDAKTKLKSEAAVARLIRVDCAIVVESTAKANEEMARQQDQRQHQAQKLEIIGELTARVAHDFNNLLAVISGYGECVVGELEPESNAHADMIEVLEASERAKALTSQLQKFLGNQTIRPQPIDLNRHIDDQRRMLQMLVGDGIELDFRLGAALPLVIMDPTALQQILANLAVNGRDAMESGGTLRIETYSTWLDKRFFHQRCIEAWPGEYFSIGVSDTGSGMDGETLEHLFDRFYTTKGPGKGTGLGLTTVSELTSQAGGHIVVDSKVGQGTFFSIYLPVDSSSTVAPGVNDDSAANDSEGLDSGRERSRLQPHGHGAGSSGWSQLVLQ